jgi:hypothetical protein
VRRNSLLNCHNLEDKMGAGGSLKQPLIKFRLFLFFFPPFKDAAVQVYKIAYMCLVLHTLLFPISMQTVDRGADNNSPNASRIQGSGE